MKLGIYTSSIAGNYGGVIQNYALQQVLLGLGHEPITIDHYKSYSRLRWVAGRLRNLSQKKKVPFPYYGRIGAKKILDFAFQNIHRTKPMKEIMPEVVDNYRLDGIIVGSDQVWKRDYGNLGAAFLDFSEGYNIKRIAYAASLGNDYWDYTEEETTKCRKLLASFNAVSVRESSDVLLCREHLGVVPQHVLDPTLLLQVNHYSRFFLTDEHVGDKYLFAYILDLDQRKLEFVKSLAANKRLNLILMSAENNTQGHDSIERWLTLINSADFVVTDSYHGTLFSINFNKNFIAINNNRRGQSRFNSILNLIGHNDRLIQPDQFNLRQVKPIDWNQVNCIIENNRQASLAFLKSALS